MKSILLALVSVSLFVALSFGCDNNISGKDFVSSPDGQIPDGAKAYSPDGKYYLHEIEPYGRGNIAVCNKDDGKEVQRWNLLGGGQNEIKGLAWAPDSKRFAVMYHGGVRPGISVFEVGNQHEVGRTDIEKWYHFMSFKDVSNITVSVDEYLTEVLPIGKPNEMEYQSLPPESVQLESTEDNQRGSDNE